MLIGELPTDEDVAHITSVWMRRSHVPNHVLLLSMRCLSPHTR